MTSLSPTQKSVLDFLRITLAQGNAPTRAEIAQHFNWGSANAAQEHLVALQRKGKIRLLRGQSRGIRLLDGPTETLKLPERSAAQRLALEVKRIWDQEGCHSEAFPPALTRLLVMVLEP